MTMRFIMYRSTLCILCLLACALLLPAPASSLTAAGAGDRAAQPSQDRLHFAQRRQCSQRAGPFATQTTAWARWREARARGYAVSNGVYPCYQDWVRGYCFNVFYPC
jgi:hypothetical protein